MPLKSTYKKHLLKFKFEAGTSRGILTERYTYFIKLWDSQNPAIWGIGEASPLKGLSVDDRPDFEDIVADFCKIINEEKYSYPPENPYEFVHQLIPQNFPALRFAFETALLDLLNGGKRQIFKNDFFEGNQSIKINGLIWMGNRDFMMQQIAQKLEQGFSCIKMKIGAIDFEQELEILKYIRNEYSADETTLRVDANGAFSPDEALLKLEKLAKLDIHSIEQPIKAGQIDEMSDLCKNTPLPIALDEELIGIYNDTHKEALISQIKPQYIILKPTLLGGFQSSEEWIKIAEKNNTAWWMTSALESNIGLNAISQFTAQFDNPLPQGLGTGSLYHNNIDSPLKIQGETLFYNQNNQWGELF